MSRVYYSRLPTITRRLFVLSLLSAIFFIMPNPRPRTQSTRWCFTINNPTDNDRHNLSQLFEHDDRKYLVVGRERGEGGTPHLQGFVVFNRLYTRTRLSTYIPRGHLEIARESSDTNAKYCKKEGDFDEYGECPRQQGASLVLDEFYKWGDDFIAQHGRAPTSPEIAKNHPTAYLRYPRCVRLFEQRAPAPKIREGEPRQWQQELEEELNGDADDRSIIFYIDDLGGKGKSWFQQYYVTKYPERAQIFSIGKRDDIAHTLDATKLVYFFNVPRTGMQYLQYTILEQMKDRMVFSPKYNSKTKFLQSNPHVVVFSNEDPDMEIMTADRYIIRRDF